MKFLCFRKLNQFYILAFFVFALTATCVFANDDVSDTTFFDDDNVSEEVLVDADIDDTVMPEENIVDGVADDEGDVEEENISEEVAAEDENIPVDEEEVEEEIEPSIYAEILDSIFSEGIKGVAYQPCPTDYFSPNTPVKYGNTDFTNSDFQALWGVDNKGITRNVYYRDGTVKQQGDLQTLADMGVNFLRLYNWQSGNNGITGWVDHTPFLDECDRLGIYVIVPVFITPDPISGSVPYQNLDWLIQSTSNHRCVVAYSIGNEIAPTVGNAQLWENIKLYANRVRELLDTNRGDQLIISPTWGSDEAMAWFNGDVDKTKQYDEEYGTNNAPQVEATGAIPIDAWSFNIYDTVAMNKIFDVCKNRCIKGVPVFISEYGRDSYYSTDRAQSMEMQLGDMKPLIDTVTTAYDNSKIYGGVIFEFTDERYKGFYPSSCGGAKELSAGLQMKQDYIQQRGGSYKTYVGGDDETIPSTLVGTCTNGWTFDGVEDKCFNEGYVGITFLANTNKTAETVLNGASVSGRTIPWIYRVDDLYIKAVCSYIEKKYKP
jgi:hypothetical protein